MKIRRICCIALAAALMLGSTACQKAQDEKQETVRQEEAEAQTEENAEGEGEAAEDTAQQDSQQTDNQQSDNQQADGQQTDSQQADQQQDSEESGVVTEENRLGPGTIRIYTQNDDATGFALTDATLDDVNPETVLEALADKGVLPADVKVLGFSKKEQDKVQVIDLDLSEKFSTYVNGLGTSAEQYVIGSICNTYLDAYNCAKIHITVAGETFVSGHAEYPGYMERFS